MGWEVGHSLELVVAAEQPAFATSVTEAVEATSDAVVAEAVESADDVIERGDQGNIDGAIVDARLDTTPEVVDHLTNGADLPVVVLASDGGDTPVSEAVEAGVTDVFPRTTAPAQYELVTERIADERFDDGESGITISEQAYREVFENVSDGLVVHDAETGEIRDVNERFCEMNGYDREALLGEDIGLVTAPEEQYGYEAASKRIERAREEGPQLFEWRNQRRDGETFPVEVHLAVVRLHGEECVLASVRDITERKRNERRFRTIAERVDEIIYLANADLTDVQYVNTAYEEVYGRPVAELEENPRAFLEAVHPEDREEYVAELEAMLADIEAGSPDDRYEFEFRIVRPDGEVRWVEATGYPILDADDHPAQFVGVVDDVTRRHRREQTLETFHEATRELTAADSSEAACRQAVDAAEEILEFPFVSVFLYDESTGALEPTAMTSRLGSLDVELPSFDAGESLPWQVFVEQESVTSSEPERPIYGPGISPPDLVLSLGSHGVMLVGGPTSPESDALGSGDVELAQILAATLEAALNHVADERALAEREAELRRQQRRADQLEQLNAIIRDIEQATVEHSSRAGIEEAVCGRLTDVDGHDVVWIAEATVSDDELSPRINAGGAQSYVDALTVELGAEAGQHPAAEAYQSGEPCVVENVATDRASGSWRKHALRHGIQSAVTVPIQYETTTHGVLTVASKTPDTFDEATRNVLAELGRSIGYAITVTERAQALESERTTELEFDIGDDGLFPVRAAETADCRVALERTIRRTGGSFSTFYLVDGAAPDELVDLASAAPSVDAAQVVSADEDDDRGLIEVTAPTWFGSVFTDHGAVVREAAAEDGTGTLVVEAPRGTDIRSLVEGFQERYPETDLLAQRQRERTIRSLFELQDALREGLTDRQWEALETAYSAGYFAWPREISGEEVAELIGVTQPTFNKHLRIAERVAFRMLLEREYPSSE